MCYCVACRNPNAYDDLPGPGSQEDTMLGGGRVLAAWQGAQVSLLHEWHCQLCCVLPMYAMPDGWWGRGASTDPPVEALCVSLVQVQLDGYPLQRTWTLLTQDVFAGNTTICVSDNVVGDW